MGVGSRICGNQYKAELYIILSWDSGAPGSVRVQTEAELEDFPSGGGLNSSFLVFGENEGGSVVF